MSSAVITLGVKTLSLPGDKNNKICDAMSIHLKIPVISEFKRVIFLLSNPKLGLRNVIQHILKRTTRELTHNVNIFDGPVHRDKEMGKIKKCSRSVRWTV